MSLADTKIALSSALEPEQVLNAITLAILVISKDDRVLYANAAAEQLFAISHIGFDHSVVLDLLPKDSPVLPLIRQVREGMSAVTEHGLTLDTPKTGQRLVNVQASSMFENPKDKLGSAVVLSFQERSIADQIANRLTHRDAARSMSAMSSMLAHEVKNPLSGIRGAAQLLEQGASEGDIELTRLIQDEADRIKDLIERMEVFSDSAPIKTGPLNIHKVLDRVRKIATHGFAKSVVFREQYDPSLPFVLGDRDQLIQVFLNLVKNAAESVPKTSGEIIFKTSYQHGIRFAMPGSQSRVHLPLSITVQDNGPGIPEDMYEHIFDPFVTTKSSGSGLGLAMVAKIVGDLGGVIDFQSKPGKTQFRVLLPMSQNSLNEGSLK